MNINKRHELTMKCRIKPPFADECLWSDFEVWADLNKISLMHHDWCYYWYCWVAALAARQRRA